MEVLVRLSFFREASDTSARESSLQLPCRAQVLSDRQGLRFTALTRRGYIEPRIYTYADGSLSVVVYCLELVGPEQIMFVTLSANQAVERMRWA